MTERTEIERLLQKTGRTLEGCLSFTQKISNKNFTVKLSKSRNSGKIECFISLM